MSEKKLFCRAATTFNAAGEFDEEAFRAFMQSFIDARIGVCLCSGGAGEGHALTGDELKRVYRAGVAACKGKVPVYANPPEQHSPRATLEQSMMAIESGVEMVNLYGPAGWHGFKPTDAELLAYYDAVIPHIKHPMTLAPLPVIGYTLKPSVLAEVCRRYSQIEVVNLTGVSDSYFVEFKDLLNRPIPIYVSLEGSLNTLALGAAGLNGGEANIVPKTYRKYIDLYEANRIDELATVFADLKRIFRFVAPWTPATPRWIKMFFRAFGLPGGEGGVRLPYLMPPEAEMRKFTEGLLRLRVPEIDDLARAAGLSVSG